MEFDIWLSRNSWEWNFIIPTFTKSIIFQRARAKNHQPAMALQIHWVGTGWSHILCVRQESILPYHRWFLRLQVRGGNTQTKSQVFHREISRKSWESHGILGPKMGYCTPSPKPCPPSRGSDKWTPDMDRSESLGKPMNNRNSCQEFPTAFGGLLDVVIVLVLCHAYHGATAWQGPIHPKLQRQNYSYVTWTLHLLRLLGGFPRSPGMAYSDPGCQMYCQHRYQIFGYGSYGSKPLVAWFSRQQSSCCRCMRMFITQNTVFRRSCLFVPTENDGPLHLKLAAAPSSYSQAHHWTIDPSPVIVYPPSSPVFCWLMLVDILQKWLILPINPHVVGWHFKMWK